MESRSQVNSGAISERAGRVAAGMPSIVPPLAVLRSVLGAAARAAGRPGRRIAGREGHVRGIRHHVLPVDLGLYRSTVVLDAHLLLASIAAGSGGHRDAAR